MTSVFFTGRRLLPIYFDHVYMRVRVKDSKKKHRRVSIEYTVEVRAGQQSAWQYNHLGIYWLVFIINTCQWCSLLQPERVICYGNVMGSTKLTEPTTLGSLNGCFVTICICKLTAM